MDVCVSCCTESVQRSFRKGNRILALVIFVSILWIDGGVLGIVVCIARWKRTYRSYILCDSPTETRIPCASQEPVHCTSDWCLEHHFVRAAYYQSTSTTHGLAFASSVNKFRYFVCIGLEVPRAVPQIENCIAAVNTPKDLSCVVTIELESSSDWGRVLYFTASERNGNEKR